ncbi:hypothetical protein PCL_07626 [Purpureocillium lilacinum]|uniref:Uncharacterized protein n=1 Tax=Purpureocillium lilacinum TaxID=33203 RepID=A0A2U3EIK5_PURLI|nr:hypothetical protein PCL_07626 [Purpureocillium lilacinum]
MERRREQRDLHGVCAALLEAPSPGCLHLELAEPVARVPRLMAWWAWFVHVSVMHGPANASQVWLQAPPAPSTVRRALAFPSYLPSSASRGRRGNKRIALSRSLLPVVVAQSIRARVGSHVVLHSSTAGPPISPAPRSLDISVQPAWPTLGGHIPPPSASSSTVSRQIGCPYSSPRSRRRLAQTDRDRQSPNPRAQPYPSPLRATLSRYLQHRRVVALTEGTIFVVPQEDIRVTQTRARPPVLHLSPTKTAIYTPHNPFWP